MKIELDCVSNLGEGRIKITSEFFNLGRPSEPIISSQICEFVNKLKGFYPKIYDGYCLIDVSTSNQFSILKNVLDDIFDINEIEFFRRGKFYI